MVGGGVWRYILVGWVWLTFSMGWQGLFEVYSG